MAFAPDITINGVDIDTLGNEEIPETRTYAVDWRRGRIGGEVSGIEALHQYIYKTLKTECNKYLIYDARYGSGIRCMVQQGVVSRAYIETDIPRLVRKALTDKRITGIHDFSFSYPEDERDAVNISFVCDTIYGELQEEVDI